MRENRKHGLMREDWRNKHGEAIEALPDERGRKQIGQPKLYIASSLLYLEFPVLFAKNGIEQIGKLQKTKAYY